MIIDASRRSCPVCHDVHLCREPEPEPTPEPGHLDQFVAQRLEPVFGTAGWTDARDIHAAYRRWALQQNLTPLSQKALGAALRRNGVPWKKNNRIQWAVTLRP